MLLHQIFCIKNWRLVVICLESVLGVAYQSVTLQVVLWELINRRRPWQVRRSSLALTGRGQHHMWEAYVMVAMSLPLCVTLMHACHFFYSQLDITLFYDVFDFQKHVFTAQILCYNGYQILMHHACACPWLAS